VNGSGNGAVAVARHRDSVGRGGGDGCCKRKEGGQPIENNQNLSFVANS
jgi:hypothetical protein